MLDRHPDLYDEIAQVISRCLTPKTVEGVMAATTEWHLERYMPLLRLLVRRIQLDPRLRRRFDSSDLVQETLLNAQAQLDRFRGQSEGQLVKWLHQILEHTVTDQVRKARAHMRNVAQEQPVQAVLAESSDRLEAFLDSGQPSPSEEAERQELLLCIADALEQLPEDQRDVVILRDLNSASVGDIATQMGRTRKSVAGLLLRGRGKLRELLSDYE
jgi:RNA polymerase sigma-70 factor (ECF subfamily)